MTNALALATVDTFAGRVMHADAAALLRSLPDACVDVVATDPPYGIGYASSRKTRTGGSPRSTLGTFGPDVMQLHWLSDAARVLRPGGAMYLFTRWDVMHIWKAAIENAGLKVVLPIVWDKLHWGMGNLDYFGSQTEHILFCVKGAHSLKWDKRTGNLWQIWKAEVWNDGNYDNPTQKPEALMRKIIALSCPPDGIVCDPFVGSGTTAVAARSLGRRFIAGDISAYQVDIARARLAEPYTLPLFALAAAG